MANAKDISHQFGYYQKIQIVLSCLPALFNSISNVNFVFVAGDVNYRCRVAECETNNQYSPSWWPTSDVDSCSRPLFHRFSNECISSNYLGENEKCTEWIYETNNTVIAELDLACQPIKSKLIGTVHNIGIAISMLLAGCICDWIGRKTTLIICSTGICVGLLKTLTSSYYVYIALEFLESILCGGVNTAGLVLMIETCGKNKRVFSVMLIAFSISLGEVIFGCIAMAVANWKTLIYIVYSPAILFLLYIPFCNESIRWLIVNNKIDKAIKALTTMIKMNKIDMDPQDIYKMDVSQLKVACDVEIQEERERLVDALKCKEILKRLFVASFCRFAAGFTYYGLTFNSVTLPGNKHTNFLLSALVSFPGDVLCLIAMNKFGRKLPLIYGYATVCVSCILFSVFSDDFYQIKITFYLISKVMIAACYTGIVTYTVELFPTSVRGSLLGICILIAAISIILAPLTPALTSINPILTVCCFGISCLIATFLLFLTPETSTSQLTDTIKQLSESIDKQKQDQIHGIENSAFNNSTDM